MINYKYVGNDLYIEINTEVDTLFPNLKRCIDMGSSRGLYIKNGYYVVSEALNPREEEKDIFNRILTQMDKHNRTMKFNKKFKEILQ